MKFIKEAKTLQERKKLYESYRASEKLIKESQDSSKIIKAKNLKKGDIIIATAGNKWLEEGNVEVTHITRSNSAWGKELIVKVRWIDDGTKDEWYFDNVDEEVKILTSKDLTEGTWSVPNNTLKAKKLKRLMSKPIDKETAKKALYGIFGDDDLFDNIEDAFNPEDVRDEIRFSLKSFIKNHSDKIEPEALTILQTLTESVLKEDTNKDEDRFVLYFPHVEPKIVSRERAINFLETELEFFKKYSGAGLAGRGYAIYCLESIDTEDGHSWEGRYSSKDFLKTLTESKTIKENSEKPSAGFTKEFLATIPNSEDFKAYGLDVDLDSAREEIPEAPETPEDMGIAGVLNNLIIDEWEAIDGYNSAIVTLADLGKYDEVEVLKDIVNEENIHVGQLQQIMKSVSPNAESIGEGEVEAAEQLNKGDIE